MSQEPYANSMLFSERLIRGRAKPYYSRATKANAETENLAFSIGLRLISSSRTDTNCKRGLRLHRRLSAKRENYFTLKGGK